MSDIAYGYRVESADGRHLDFLTWDEALEYHGDLEREDEHCLARIVPIRDGVPGDLMLWPRPGTGLRPW